MFILGINEKLKYRKWLYPLSWNRTYILLLRPLTIWRGPIFLLYPPTMITGINKLAAAWAGPAAPMWVKLWLRCGAGCSSAVHWRAPASNSTQIIELAQSWPLISQVCGAGVCDYLLHCNRRISVRGLLLSGVLLLLLSRSSFWYFVATLLLKSSLIFSFT